MPKKLLIVSVLAIVIVLGRILFLVVPASGYFTDLESILMEQCKAVEVSAGPEDIAIDHRTGVAYIATTDRRHQSGQPRGAIYTLDLKDHNAEPRNILGRVPAEFYAHGISLWRDENDALRLFAINHSESGERVELFDVVGSGSLRHVETISADAMRSLNDLVAVGPRQFYASNDTRFKQGFGQLAELYLGLPLGSVIYFDGQNARTVADGFAYANGVNVSLDGKKTANDAIKKTGAVELIELSKIYESLGNRIRNHIDSTPSSDIDIEGVKVINLEGYNAYTDGHQFEQVFLLQC